MSRASHLKRAHKVKNRPKSKKSVSNQGPRIIMEPGSQLNVGQDINNGGTLDIDLTAKVNVGRDLNNTGTINIKDFSQEQLIRLTRDAIKDSGDKEVTATLISALEALENNRVPEAQSNFKKLTKYVGLHPEFLLGGVQILMSFLQLNATH